MDVVIHKLRTLLSTLNHYPTMSSWQEVTESQNASTSDSEASDLIPVLPTCLIYCKNVALAGHRIKKLAPLLCTMPGRPIATVLLET